MPTVMKMVAFFSFCFIREKKGEVELTRIFGSRSRSSRSHFSRQRPPLHTHTHKFVTRFSKSFVYTHKPAEGKKEKKHSSPAAGRSFSLSRKNFGREKENPPHNLKWHTCIYIMHRIRLRKRSWEIPDWQNKKKRKFVFPFHQNYDLTFIWLAICRM
jgi:hypothetical protein